MKAVILAAGKGIRLQPLTNDIPKSSVLVSGRPFLYYVIKELEKAGFSQNDIGIVIGYRKEKIEEFADEFGLGVTLIDQGEPLGTGHAVSAARDFVADDNFVVVMGDNLYGAENIRKIANNDDLCYITGFHHGEPEKFGVLVVDDEKLVRIIEKPKQRITDLINTGLYKFTPEIFEALKQIKKSERGEYELTDAISQLADKNKVMVVEIETWLDLGDINDIQKIEDYLKENWKE